MGEYTIYRIRFSDGAEYIGRTRQTLEDRIKQVRYANQGRAANIELTDRLNGRHFSDSSHTIEVLEQGLDYATALYLENRYIKSTRCPINKTGHRPWNPENGAALPPPLRESPSALRYHWKPRSSGMHVCSECREYLDAQAFPSDSSRFNGLNSRCRECERKRNRKRYRAIKEKNKAWNPPKGATDFCVLCAQRLPIADFPKVDYRHPPYRPICHTCWPEHAKRLREQRRATRAQIALRAETLGNKQNRIKHWTLDEKESYIKRRKEGKNPKNPPFDRQCSRCKESKDVSEFYINRKNSPPIDYRCRSCKRKSTLESRKKARMRRMGELRTCRVCQKEQHAEKFPVAFGSDPSLRGWCEGCRVYAEHETWRQCLSLIHI